MAPTAAQTPTVDYVSIPTQRPRDFRGPSVEVPPIRRRPPSSPHPTPKSPGLSPTTSADPPSQVNNITTSTYDWDTSPYSDPTLLNSLSDSCDSLLSPPTSPESLVFPQNTYKLPKDETNPTIKQEDTFSFGNFEDWMRWDDPSDAALSPESEFFPDFKVESTSPDMRSLELQGSGIPTNSNNENLVDDDAIFVEELTEEPLFQTPGSLITPPLAEIPRENLYSTPLSWTRPTLQQQQRSNFYPTVLTPQQESHLRSIAMPPQSTNATQYPASPSDSSSPEPSHSNHKRKSSPEDDDDDEGSPAPRNGRPVKKTAHNMIEKRYRTNLNDKIAALRDSVPSLRVMSKKNSRGEAVREEDLQGLSPAHKLNKATVLSKATEYIAHLEKRNKFLAKENAALKSRVDAFEILVMSRQGQTQLPPPQQPQQQRRPSSQRFDIDGMM